MAKFESGSEWHKWDLHVHTPKSIIQHYGGDTEEVWEKYISDLESLPAEYKVLGINDYIFLDGYKKVLEYKNEGRLSNIDLILPVIELRVDKFASQAHEAWKKVNLHIIFSDNLDVEDIQVQFLYAINSSTTIYETGEKLKGVVNEKFLEELGKQIKDSSSVTISGSLKVIGFDNLVFDYENVLEALDNTCFKGKYLSAVGKSEWDKMRWDGSAALKKTIINNANFLFHSIEKPEDYHSHLESLKKQNVNYRLLDCSDAHSFSDRASEKDRIGNSFTWLKADLTFEGLKQVANDQSRIFIGDEPPLLQRIRNNPTKFIDSLSIEKIEDSTLSEKWFEDFKLDLNPSMVAIIGNKGQGKSAIADIIGLLGNTPNYRDFSFLEKRKFRKPKPNRAENFEAHLKWSDNTIASNVLNNDPEETSVEKVKYLPQNFIEKLCNDDLQVFEKELRGVIYSHLSESDKLGKESLDELIEFQSEIINKDIDGIKGQIQAINKKIIELEKKDSENYKKALKEKIKNKENELNAHIATKPTPIEAPTDEKVIEKNKGIKEITEQITEIREQLPKLNKKIEDAQKSLTETKIEISKIEKAIQSIDSFEKQFESLRFDIQPIFEQNSLKLDDTISLKIDREPLSKLLEEKQNLAISLNESITNEKKTGFLDEKEKIENKLKELQGELDEQSKAYQKYLDSLKQWGETKKLIEGSEEKEGSLLALKSQESYIEKHLPKDLTESINSRKDLIEELFNKKEKIIALYKNLFEPITKFIDDYGDLLEDYNIKLDVDLKIEGFEEKFFDHISLGNKGSFIGNPAGLEKLNQIIENNDLKTSEGVVSFLNEIILNLKTDQREDQGGVKRDIELQLKKDYSVLDLYTYLFNLDYLTPEYKLKLGEKNLSELSPGERGALLLIFYLTLDQNDIPLVIDQPEENLDNQSVFKILVQFIKRAKEKRQIIIVTHNPNLAVACNAEQIIHVSIDKEDGNLISIMSGSLENPKINNAVIDILEGTYPALNTRTNTYGIIERTREELGLI